MQSAVIGQLLAGTGVDATDVRRAQQLDLAVVTVSDRGEREGGFGAALASTMALAMLLRAVLCYVLSLSSLKQLSGWSRLVGVSHKMLSAQAWPPSKATTTS